MLNRLESFFGVKALLGNHPSQDLPKTKEIYQKTLRIAWPSAMEAILISLIGAVDMMMVGGIGTNAIAAVGITTQPKFIFMSMVIALNIGTTVIVSRRKGANDKVGANKALRNGLMLSFMISLASSILGYVFAKPILQFAGASTEYLLEAMVYFRIILIGNFFYLIGLTMTAAQRGIGNTKISMITNISANVVNIIFNYLLINGIWFFPRWGVMGAAVATAIGNGVSLVLATRSLLDKDSFLSITDHQHWSLDKETVRLLWSISSSAFVEQLFLRIGFLMYSKAVAGLGTVQFATHYIAMQIMSITFSVGEGLSIATSSLVGQSLGAKRSDLAIIYGKASQRMALVVSIFVSLGIILTRASLIGFFTSDVIIIAMGSNVLLILSGIVFFQISQVITLGSLRGAGDVKFSAMLSLISVALIRPSLTYIFAYTLGWGLYGAWYSVVADQAIRFGVSRWRFHKAEWLKIEI